jgi:hypothetical protein
MASDRPDWHQALARVNGQLVREEQRMTTHELCHSTIKSSFAIAYRVKLSHFKTMSGHIRTIEGPK